MAKYTAQLCSESGSFAHPEGTQSLRHANNLSDLAWYLENWADQHSRVGSSEHDAYLMVWKGFLKDVTDIYPDFMLKYGPRMGVVRELV
jgi:hypothetical protein